MIREGIEKRLTDSIENVLQLTDGLLVVDIDGWHIYEFQPELLPVLDCSVSIDEIEPRSFSFNNPFGACPTCYGLGYKMEFDPELMIPDPSLSINEGAIAVMGWQSSKDEGSFSKALLHALARRIWVFAGYTVSGLSGGSPEYADLWHWQS